MRKRSTANEEPDISSVIKIKCVYSLSLSLAQYKTGKSQSNLN